MGCSNSKIEDQDVLLRCRERKRFIKLAIENRYAWATAHVAYIQALRNIGISLRQFSEAEVMLESSMSTCPTMASELAVVPQKFQSPFPSSSSSGSPSPSPRHSLSPGRVGSSSPHKSLASHDSNSPASHAYASPLVNYMRSKGTQAVTVEERPPSVERGTLESFSSAPQSGLDLDPSSAQPATPPPPSASGSFAWDFFNPFTTLDNPYHFSDRRGPSHSPERDLGDLEQVREEEGIPDLEDGGQGEQGMEEEIEQVHIENRTSRGDFIDPYTKQSEIANQTAVDSGTSSKEHVTVSSADAFTPDLPKPSVAKMAQFTGKVVVDHNPTSSSEANEAEVTRSAEKARASEKDQEVTDKESILENEYAIIISTAPRNRNLPDGMKEIEDWFLRAHEYGKEVSRMLVANKVHYHSSFTKTKGRPWTSRLFFPCSICCYRDPGVFVSNESSSRALNLITWHRSTSFQSSSSRIPFVSSSKDDIDDSSSDFGDFGEDLRTISGRHIATLESLYAWEKKLYDEVKAEECLRRLYEKKCAQLRHQEAKDVSSHVIDKTRATIKDLHSRIRVAIHAVDSVSKRIQKLRDEQLQPQLVELIEGLIRMWELMMRCHRAQIEIIKEINTPGRPAVSGVYSESHQQATVHLGNELENWHTSFSNLIGAQKAFVQALHGWLQKCILENQEVSTKRRPANFSPRIVGAPLVVIICTDWSRAFEPIRKNTNVATAKKESATDSDTNEVLKMMNGVLSSIRYLAVNVQKVSLQRDELQQQKRKATKDLDRKVASMQRVESRMLYTRASPLDRIKINTSKYGTPMVESKKAPDLLKKSEDEKMRHHKGMQQTHESFLITLQTNLEEIFTYVTKFASLYKDELRRAITYEPHVNKVGAYFP